ncbi:cupin domain-containing protein [Granulicella arctica]|uniref:Quercetin dioxygenase-like cupin family protein n=1 Tax=Granulicella arctica TaxID=940613 RepID=A0A7Y9PE87_9BACT|nr:cupin domain-containing protein [Granulicella arctica]NYF78290.1 quercetin dioxygenase-like cupin family protein [Granulicella arctica]
MTVTFLQSRHETNGCLDAFEVTLPPHVGSLVPRFHRDYEETVLGIDGITTWTVEGRQIQVCPGEQLVIPPGALHAFINLHEQAARVLCIHTPGIIGPEYFDELALVMEADGPTDYAAVGAVMARYGIIPATF